MRLLTIRASIPIIAALLAAHASAAAADSEQPVADLQALNACIVAAIDEGATWPGSPVEVLNHLFSLSPDCVLPTTGALGQGEAGADSSAVLVFRHSLPRRPGEGQWLQAQLSPEADGTWRVRLLTPYLEAQRREAAARIESSRLNGIQMSGFDTDLGPASLLQFLKGKRGAWVAPMFPKGWIRESDLEALVGLVHSTEPCAGVISMVSSVHDTTTSTVGNEAAYLIEGFIAGRYPPRLVSTRPRCDVPEIELWWSKRQAR